MARITPNQITMALRLCIAVLIFYHSRTQFSHGKFSGYHGYSLFHVGDSPIWVRAWRWQHLTLADAHGRKELSYKTPFAKRTPFSNRWRGSVGGTCPRQFGFGRRNAATEGFQAVAERSLAGGRRIFAGDGKAKLPVLLGAGEPADWIGEGPMQRLEK